MTAEPPLLVGVEGGVARLTLNRPGKRNALNAKLVLALGEALERTARDPGVRVVLLTGEGRDFCAGADLAELEAAAERGREASLDDARRLGDLFVSLREHPRPVVAGVRGRALAGGCGLALACDLVVAEEAASFGLPEIHLGFVPAMVMAILRGKLAKGPTFELVARGDPIPASEARGLGLVNRVLPAAEFAQGLEAYVADLAARPPGAMEMTKRLHHDLDGLPFNEGIALGAEVNSRARLTEECRAGVRAFLARKRAGSGGAS